MGHWANNLIFRFEISCLNGWHDKLIFYNFKIRRVIILPKLILWILQLFSFMLCQASILSSICALGNSTFAEQHWSQALWKYEAVKHFSSQAVPVIAYHHYWKWIYSLPILAWLDRAISSGLVKGVPVHGMGVGIRWSLRSLQIQAILWLILCLFSGVNNFLLYTVLKIISSVGKGSFSSW